MTARLVACPPVRWKISFAIMVRGLSSESRLARGRMFALRSVLRVYGVGVEWSLVFTQGFAGSLPTSIGRGLTAAAPDGGRAANGLFAVLRAVAAGEPQALAGLIVRRRDRLHLQDRFLEGQMTISVSRLVATNKIFSVCAVVSVFGLVGLGIAAIVGFE